MGMGMNFMGWILWEWGCRQWRWGVGVVKVDGMGWGRGSFCGDGWGWGLMSTPVSLFNREQPTAAKNQKVCCS